MSPQVCVCLNPVHFPQITVIVELSGVFTLSLADRAVIPRNAPLPRLLPASALPLGLRQGPAGGTREHCSGVPGRADVFLAKSNTLPARHAKSLILRYLGALLYAFSPYAK